MAEKKIKTRIQLKHDTEANWKLATNFTPLAGELIIYDKDATHSYERFKLGDGSTLVNNLPFIHNIPVAYGTCSTAAATAAKVVTVDTNTPWILVPGATITVKFSSTNTANNPTLNVDSTGAKSIIYGTSPITTGNSYAGYKDRYIKYVYNGTYYVFMGWSYDSNSDTKVQQNAAIATAGEYPVMLAYSTDTTKVTNALNKTSTLKYNPSTQILTAPKFKGALQGNADTATKATQDAAGNVITTTYATKSELAGKADSSHGIHVTTETVKSALGTGTGTSKYLREDGTWVTPPDTTYSLPSAGTALGGVKTGGDVTISAGVITVKDDSHNHTISNVDNLQTSLDAKLNITDVAAEIAKVITCGTSDPDASTTGLFYFKYLA